MAPPRTDLPGAFSPLQQPELCDRIDLGAARHWEAADTAVARTWFKSHVAVYVLSFPGATDRLDSISSRLAELGICFQHVSGIDLRASGSLGEARDAGWVLGTFNASRAQEVAYSEKQQMGPIVGTLGAAASHFKALDEIGRGPAPLAVVFEDDARPSEDFVERLWSMVTGELSCGWDVVSLSSWCPYGRCSSPHLVRVQPDVNEPEWRCRQGVNWGLQGMLYRAVSLPKLRERWMSVVYDAERPHCLNLDTALASISDEFAYYAVPAAQQPGLLKEGDFSSVRFRINAAAAAGEFLLDAEESPLPRPVSP